MLQGPLDSFPKEQMKNDMRKMDEVMAEIAQWDPYKHEIFQGHEGAVWSTLSTLDNRYIFSGSEDKSIIIWDAQTKGIYGRLLGHTGTINALELTESDDLLISGAWDHSIRIWDWRNLTEVFSLDGHTNGVYCFAMTKDKKTLISGAGDYKVRIWDLATLTEAAVLDCNSSSVFGLALAKDNKHILAGGWDSHIRIWNIDSKALLVQHNCEAGVIQSLAVTPDSKFIIFGTRSNLVKVLNYEDKSEHFSYSVHNNWVRNLVVTSDSRYFISCSADKTMRIVNIIDKIEEFNLEGHEGYVFGLNLSRDEQFLISGASDKTMRKWPIGRKQRVAALKGHTKCIMSVAVTADDKYIVSGSEDRSVRIWNLKDCTEVGLLNGHTDTVWGVAVTLNMKYIISVSGDRSLRIWDFMNKTELDCLTGHDNPIFCVTVSLDSQYAVSGAQDKTVILWDIEHKKMIKRLEGHTDTVFTVKITHNNRYIVSGAADYTIRVWSLDTLSLYQKIETKSGMIESVSLNHDGSLLVLGDRGNSIYLWDWKEKIPMCKFTHHVKWVKCVAFAKKGDFFVSCSNDFSIRVWNVEEQRQEFVLLGHTNTIRSVLFSNSGRYVISGSEDLSIRLWDMKNIKNLELADITGPIDSFLFLSKIKQGIIPKAYVFNAVFSSLRANLAHAYSYIGIEELLKAVLEGGCPIIRDTEGNSPLTYALFRNAQGCIDILLEYFITLKSEASKLFVNYVNSVRDDFEDLIKNGSKWLPEFLEAVFIEIIEPDLPKFGMPLNDLPLFRFSHQRRIDWKIFLQKSQAIPKFSIEFPVVFKTFSIKVSVKAGSESSLILMDSIIRSANTHIFRSSIIQLLIHIKWQNIWPFLLCLSLLSWMNLMTLLLIIFKGPLPSYYIAFTLTNSLLLIYDIIKAYSIGLISYLSFFNTINLIRIFLSFLYVGLGQQSKPPDLIYVKWLIILLTFVLQGLDSLKLFKMTRFYSRLILNIIKDCAPFIALYGYTTIAFGILRYCSYEEGTDIFQAFFQAPYQLEMIGNEEMPLGYGCFVVASLVNVIFMLNLLILVLGDSFDRINSEAAETESAEMAEIIAEIERLMFWKRKLNDKQYLHTCESPASKYSEETWEGKINTINKLMEINQSENRKNFKNINKQLSYLETMKSKYSEIEKKINKIVVK